MCLQQDMPIHATTAECISTAAPHAGVEQAELPSDSIKRLLQDDLFREAQLSCSSLPLC